MILNWINELDIMMRMIYGLALIVILALQYLVFVNTSYKVKRFAILYTVYMVIHVGIMFFTKGTYGQHQLYLGAGILLIIMSFNLPALLVTLILRELVTLFRRIRFKWAMKKAYQRTSGKALKHLGRVLPYYHLRHALKDNEIEQLKHIYKDAKNDNTIELAVRVKYCKALILVGIPNISVPHTYDVNMDVLATEDDVLKVARAALNEAKLIVKLAPNACVFSCRKYAENLAKYLFSFHNLQSDAGDDLESFSTLLYLLNKHKVIEDKSLLNHFYHIKEVGNDAAHGHFCDGKTAADVVEDSATIDQWFLATYGLSE